jgi:hypothetical protein
MKDELFPAAEVRPAEDLTELLAEAVAEHDEGERWGRESLEHYRLAGLAFKKAKAAAGHGKWLAALKRTGVSSQRASECMRLADGWEKLPPGGNFGLKGALALIAGNENESNGESANTFVPEPEPANFWETVRDLGGLLVEARRRVIARGCARHRAEPYTGESPDELIDAIKAKLAENSRAFRDKWLLVRCKHGDEESRRTCAWFLAEDGVPREEAAAMSERIHAGLRPPAEDVDRLSDAFVGWHLRKEGYDVEADAAADEKEEQDAYTTALGESFMKFLSETGRDPFTPVTSELADEWEPWYRARQKAAGWDVSDD